MIVSMTGFASATRENDLAIVAATVKTVNHGTSTSRSGCRQCSPRPNPI